MVRSTGALLLAAVLAVLLGVARGQAGDGCDPADPSRSYDQCGQCVTPEDPVRDICVRGCDEQPFSLRTYDDCGQCLEADHPDFNNCRVGCDSMPFSTMEYDQCGQCLEPDAPEVDNCLRGCDNGPFSNAVYDECGQCLDPIDPEFNSCVGGCDGVPFSTLQYDGCGVCGGTNEDMDDCGVCGGDSSTCCTCYMGFCDEGWDQLLLVETLDEMVRSFRLIQSLVGAQCDQLDLIESDEACGFDMPEGWNLQLDQMADFEWDYLVNCLSGVPDLLQLMTCDYNPGHPACSV